MKIKAAVLHDVNTPLRIEEIDLADPKPGEVRVKIDSVGLCQTDVHYMMRALEAGICGFCVVTCPHGECRLSQGNYRAETRLKTVQRLLGEIGLEPERIELLRSSTEDEGCLLEEQVRGAVDRIIALNGTPLTEDPGAPDAVEVLERVSMGASSE